MQRIRANSEQINYVKKELEKGHAGTRGDFEGDYNSAFFGLLAETIICDRLHEERPIINGQFDGGHDVVINGKKYDVKCELRNSYFKPRLFVHNLSGHQINYNTDGYIFLNYNKIDGIFEICGIISKEDFKTNAEFYAEGTKRLRSDGTEMIVKGAKGVYEIKQKHLKEVQL